MMNLLDVDGTSRLIGKIKNAINKKSDKAFAKVNAADGQISATSKDDTLILAAGQNVTLTPEAGVKKVTISSADTWRGIQDNLTSSSTNDSLSAAQGKKLNETKLSLAGGTMTGELNIKPPSGEGGEIHLCASTANRAENGIAIDEAGGNFRIFGIPSADGSTKTGSGTALAINPYTKTITGGYTFTGSVSGNASTATKLGSSAGSTTTPVYFSDGKPVACSYTLGKSVPSNAVFTDTTYGTATESTNGLLSASDKKKLGLIHSASCTKGASTRSTLLGTGNKDNGDENIIAAGYGNTIGNATQSAIIAGSGNNIPIPSVSSNYYRNSTIINGHANYVAGSNVLVAGNNNNAYANQTAFGHFCKLSTLESSDSGTASRTAFMIGNGSSDSSRSNAFRVNYNGTVYATNSTIATGADYAEYFEWADGNPNGEDRVGLFVTFDERDPEKIKTASPGDYILGIVSGHPNTIGNGDEDWRGRYVLDDFGRYIEETYEYEETWTDKDGKVNTETREGIRYKENPDYDPEEQYIPREERSEWSAIGMVGLLSVYDDGTCQVNGYCRCGKNGIATLAEERTLDTYRVIQRINNNIIKVVIKP